MLIRSDYPATVFWRTFTKADTVYLIGLKQGTMNRGGSVDYQNPSGFFQLELKRGNLFGPTLVGAGHVYADTDEYLLTTDGKFLSVADDLTITMDQQRSVGPLGLPVWQFFEQGDTASSITVTSTVTVSTTQSGTTQTTTTTEATDSTGAQVGAKESASGTGGGKPGIELSQLFSQSTTAKISKTIQNSLNSSITTSSTYTEQGPIELIAHRLTSVETSWQREYITGHASVGSIQFTFSATTRVFSSRKNLNYDSPDNLPSDAMAAYQAQYPAYLPPIDLRDGAVLREQDNPPVNVIFGGAKFWIPSGEVLNRLYGGWGKVVIVPDGALASVPTMPKDGTIVREDSHAEVWLIKGGAKCHITSPDVLVRFGGWDRVDVVPDDSTASFPIGTPVV